MKRNRNGGSGAPPERDNTPSRVRKEKWRALIVELYLKGNSQRAVRDLATEQTGHSFGLGFVNSAIAQAVEQWKTSKAEMVDNHKAIELEKINRLEATYWEAWFNSLKSTNTKTETKTKGKDAARLALSQVENQERPGQGDPRYLNGVQWCVEQRCKILGIEVPTTAIQINNNTGGNTTIVRRVVFKTRETSARPQIIANPD